MKTTIFIPLSWISLTLAWGNLGHQTIAYIATDFVTSETKSWAQNILGDSSTSYLANVATWADTFKYTSTGSFSEPFHFIDALDSPPESCNVDYDRDCGADNCVVSAIVNYTSLVVDSSVSKTTRNESLMFLVHFLGDIHQPLHDENLDYGGNDIDVKYGSTSTNLHHIWDTNMPEDYAGGYSLTDARTWATSLTQKIKSGTYSSQADGWLNDMDISDPQGSAMAWASDANAYVCSTVMPDGISSVENKDLSGTYYETALPVIQLQFAKAGYRLAAWLNLIVTGSTGL
jgi:hypothetical protein